MTHITKFDFSLDELMNEIFCSCGNPNDTVLGKSEPKKEIVVENEFLKSEISRITKAFETSNEISDHNRRAARSWYEQQLKEIFEIWKCSNDVLERCDRCQAKKKFLG